MVVILILVYQHNENFYLHQKIICLYETLTILFFYKVTPFQIFDIFRALSKRPDGKIGYFVLRKRKLHKTWSGSCLKTCSSSAMIIKASKE